MRVCVCVCVCVGAVACADVRAQTLVNPTIEDMRAVTRVWVGTLATRLPIPNPNLD